MGVIIKMDSKKFIKKFLEEQNPNEFQFILISENITTRDEFKNVKSLPRLLPPPPVAAELVNKDMKTFKKLYLDYIKIPEIEALISIMVQAAVVNDLKLVLLCSQSESEYEYIDAICDYIEAVYGLETYSYKEYKSDPEKAGKVKNKEELVTLLNKKFKKMEQNKTRIDEKPNAKALKKELKEFGRKDLLKLAKSKKVKVKKDADKKDIIKKIVKKLTA